MKLESLDGSFVELSIVSYQFAQRHSTSNQADTDANWLVIDGTAWDGHESWSFRDPCMDTWEARELATWLGWLADTDPVRPRGAGPSGSRLWLTEPNLMFEDAGVSDGIVAINIHFDAESRPPSKVSDPEDDLGYRVQVVLPQAALLSAIADWVRDVERFPVR